MFRLKVFVPFVIIWILILLIFIVAATMFEDRRWQMGMAALGGWSATWFYYQLKNIFPSFFKE